MLVGSPRVYVVDVAKIEHPMNPQCITDGVFQIMVSTLHGVSLHAQPPARFFKSYGQELIRPGAQDTPSRKFSLLPYTYQGL